MSFEIEAVLKEMSSAMRDAVEDDASDIRSYAAQVLQNEKDSLQELGEARIRGEISASVFDAEIEREKKVVEVELLTLQIMTDAAAEKAVNAALNVFVEAVKKAL